MSDKTYPLYKMYYPFQNVRLFHEVLLDDVRIEIGRLHFFQALEFMLYKCII